MRFTNPPPFNEDDFESLCLAVFRRALAANDLARYGRRGQRQDGIDLLGHSVGSYRLLAVQCKLRNKNRALTNLYNERPTWLDLAHQRLDQAVAAAYAWPNDLTDEQTLEKLLELNLSREHA